MHKWPVGAGGATGRHSYAAVSGAARPLAAGLAAAGPQLLVCACPVDGRRRRWRPASRPPAHGPARPRGRSGRPPGAIV